MEEQKGGNKLVKLVFVVVAMVVIILFAIDNSENVPLGLVFGETQVPLTALIIGCFLLGLFVGLILLFSSSRKSKKMLKSKDLEIENLEQRLGFLNEKIDEISKGPEN